jgi:hypothetical protein
MNVTIASFVISVLKALVSKSKWLSVTEIITSSIAPYLSIFWGGVVSDVSEMKLEDDRYIYLLLTSESYLFFENKWVKSSCEPARTGEGKASVVFNNLKNVASGDMSAAFGNRTKATGTTSFVSGVDS